MKTIDMIQSFNNKRNREKGYNNFETGAMLVVVVLVVVLLTAFMGITG